MKIRTTVEALNEAFEIASIVKPKLKGSNASAYLIASHGGKLFIHSADGHRYICTELAADSIEGEGAFAFPSDKVKSLNFVEGWIEIESGQDDNRHWVKYKTEGGAKVDLSTYDHANYNTLVSKLRDATEERQYPTAVLLGAIRAVSGYAPPVAATVKEELHRNTLQIYDTSKPEWAPGDGVMFASDGYRSAYFSCDALKGRGLGIHIDHLGHLTNFLSKCGPEIKIKFSEEFNFLVELKPDASGALVEGAVFGWANIVKHYSHYKYYSTNEDKVIMMVPKDLIVKSLKHMRSVLDPDQLKIRLSLKDSSLNLEASSGSDRLTSAPVGVDLLPRQDQSPSTPEFGYNANVIHLLALFEPMCGHAVEFRVVFVSKTASRKEGAYFRTIEKYNVDNTGAVVITSEGTHECRVTRFSPSM